ncbi:MAG: YgiQ family radical SAM protein [Spirochaetales bacterium]|nr:YgiQ family radical SAM protein [Spirochaetales bacterium]
MKRFGFSECDIILVTGDTYIDSPFIGVALIGKVLLEKGYRVGIIAQPDTESPGDITRLGEPRLFWGITGGCMDSMVANYTATKKFRKSDDLTPGGINNRRPDRAVIVYANLIRRYFKNTAPLVLGGVEASLRRICHYDYWSNKVRNSVLFDAKADILVYGMAEKTVAALAEKLDRGEDYRDLRGICYPSGEMKRDYIMLPSADEVASDKEAFARMFAVFYENTDPHDARGLLQRHGNRYLVHNPPGYYETEEELDRIHSLDFERDVHPWYGVRGRVRALDTIRFSITSHRGCAGECNFCSISIHQGRVVRSRSVDSIVSEAERFKNHPDFRGIITDTGGPTANMYGAQCRRWAERGACRGKRCLFPRICNQYESDHKRQISLLKRLEEISGVKKVFLASGIRHDLVLSDKNGFAYLEQILRHHTSGQLKLAPEHSEEKVLALMGKTGGTSLTDFMRMFERLAEKDGKKQFLTYYFMAAHPGCTGEDMMKLDRFIRTNLKIRPEQVQIFTPTPSTWSTLMYYTGINPFTCDRLFVEKGMKAVQRQKDVIQ